MKRIGFALIILLAAVSGFYIGTAGSQERPWVIVADPYVPAEDGSVGIPTEFVVRVDDGSEIVIQAVDPSNFPAYFPGTWRTGSAAFVFSVNAYKGAHTLVAKARNAEGESVWSDPFAFSIPLPPQGLRNLKLTK